MLKARYKKYNLKFKRPSGTSRGVLTEKETYFIILQQGSDPQLGIGECSMLKGLSHDDNVDYEKMLIHVCDNISEYVQNPHESLVEWPSICFGIETALQDLKG